jgi:hypothetical protein
MRGQVVPDPLIGPGSPLIVELLGLPGAGKSTLAAALLASPSLVAPHRVLDVGRLPLPSSLDAALRSGVDRLPTRSSSLARRALWRQVPIDPLAEIARTHREFLELVAHAPPPEDADPAHVLRWRSWPSATIETHVRLRRTDAPSHTVLVEEGIVQRSNTVCAGAPELAARYFASQPLPDALVVLSADPRTAHQRIGTRAKRPLLRHEGQEPGVVLADLERTARLIVTAVEVLRGRGLTVLELDATDPVPTLQDRVLSLVATLPPRGGR